MRLPVFLFLLLAMPCWAEPLTLTEAARRTLENHPITRSAAFQVKADDARLTQSRAPYYPSFSAITSYRHTQERGVEESGIPIPISDTNLYRAGLSGSQTLLDFGKRFHNSREAEFELEATKQLQERLLQDLLLNTGSSFFSVQRDARLKSIQRHDLRLTDLRLDEALSMGKTVDISQLQANLASTRVTLTRAQNAELRSRLALGTAMGSRKPVSRPLAAVTLQEPSLNRKDAMALGLRRPRVLQSYFQAKADERGLESARADYFPTLTLNADYGWSDRSYPLEQTRWGVGVNLSIPILNEPFLSASVARAEAQYERSLAEADNEELQALQEVGDSLIRVRDARARARLGYLSSIRAIEGFLATWALYRANPEVGRIRDVTDAQRDMISALTSEAQAHFEYQTAVLLYFHSTGTLNESVFSKVAEGRLTRDADTEVWMDLLRGH